MYLIAIKTEYITNFNEFYEKNSFVFKVNVISLLIMLQLI